MRKHNYVVGFVGERQCIYGKIDNDSRSWIDPLTLFQAKGRVKHLYRTRGLKRAIYEIKLLKVID